MEFQESRTFTNLMNAYEGKLISSSKYEIYGAQAMREGYIQIGNIFDLTSNNDREHAIIWLRLINEGVLPDTLQNLQDAAANEEYVASNLYLEYASVATEEGYSDIASLFNGIANIGLNHEFRFEALIDNIETDQVFCKKEATTLWVCTVCGNILSGICAPERCPICGYPQGYYQLYLEVY